MRVEITQCYILESLPHEMFRDFVNMTHLTVVHTMITDVEFLNGEFRLFYCKTKQTKSTPL